MHVDMSTIHEVSVPRWSNTFYFIIEYAVHSEVIGAITFLHSHTDISKHLTSQVPLTSHKWETLLG